MSPLLVNLLKVLFVVVLYGFLWVVARSIRSHLAPAPERTTPEPAALVIVGPGGDRVIPVDGPTTVGRSAGSDVPIDDPYASEVHLRFDRVGGRLVVEDLGATNPTLVNGLPVAGRRSLERGDVLRVGQTIMEVR